MIRWLDGQKTIWSEVWMTRWLDGQKTIWSEVWIARSQDYQKSRWFTRQILKKLCSQCYTGYDPNVLPALRHLILNNKPLENNAFKEIFHQFLQRNLPLRHLPILNETTLFMYLDGDLPTKTQNVMFLVVKLSLPLTQRNGKDRAQIFS